ncbi:O-antigen ligase family protein [Actinoplanes sp. NPDC049316]|uniref:O-antigen ligase family protein n=1 Tax=Actinoplanes sp. NPDC049316 TaxID=3154727 RepID=UPI0034202885
MATAQMHPMVAGDGSAARGPVRPSILVAGTVLLICVPSRISDVSASGHITAADLGAGLVVAVVAARLLAGDRSVAGRGWLPFGFALASFAAATVTASDVSASVIGFIRYSELFVLVPVAVAMSLRDRLDLFLVAGAIITVTVVEGGVGVYQYLTKTGASYAGEYVRAVGTFGAEQVMALAALLGYGLVVTLALGLALRGRARLALLAGATFLLLPLGLTLSRGAWIATACAVLVLLVVANWRMAVALVGVGALGFAVLTLTAGSSDPASGTFDQRITSIASSGSEPDQSVQDRYALWHAATAIWADHPVLGVGLKDFPHYRDSYASVALSAGSDVGDPTTGVGREPLLSAHNQYLMVLSEQGTVGILAFATLLGTLAAGAVRRRESLLPPQGRRFLDLAAPALMVWTLVDFLYGDIGGGPSSVLLAVTLGLVARRGVVAPRPRPGGTA